MVKQLKPWVRTFVLFLTFADLQGLAQNQGRLERISSRLADAAGQLETAVLRGAPTNRLQERAAWIRAILDRFDAALLGPIDLVGDWEGYFDWRLMGWCKTTIFV